jgi:hypothetical protein
MTTLTTRTEPDLAAATNARTTVAAAALTGVVASAGGLAGWFVLADPGKASAARAPITVIECVLAGLAFVVLAVSLPSLARVTRLPLWALSFAGMACAFIAIEAWAFGTVIAHLAHEVSAAQFDQLGKPTFLSLLLRLPMQVLAPIAFVTLAVVGWRRAAMPRAASVLLAIGGVSAIIGDFPPVGLLAGLALAWTARSAQASQRG